MRDFQEALHSPTAPIATGGIALRPLQRGAGTGAAEWRRPSAEAASGHVLKEAESAVLKEAEGPAAVPKMREPAEAAQSGPEDAAARAAASQALVAAALALRGGIASSKAERAAVSQAVDAAVLALRGVVASELGAAADSSAATAAHIPAVAPLPAVKGSREASSVAVAADDTARALEAVTAILSKLTPQTLDTRADQVVEAGINSPTLLTSVTSLLFEKVS